MKGEQTNLKVVRRVLRVFLWSAEAIYKHTIMNKKNCLFGMQLNLQPKNIDQICRALNIIFTSTRHINSLISSCIYDHQCTHTICHVIGANASYRACLELVSKCESLSFIHSILTYKFVPVGTADGHNYHLHLFKTNSSGKSLLTLDMSQDHDAYLRVQQAMSVFSGSGRQRTERRD